MTARVLIATDLDRTLIYSRAAAGDCPPADLVPVEHMDGRPMSFMTATGVTLLSRLLTEHVVVPVTTRTPEQLARVRLPGPPPRYAVAANGGVLLVDGVPDADWAQRVRIAVADVAPHHEALAALTRACDPTWSKTPRTAADLFCYAVVDRLQMPTGALASLTEWARTAGWTVSLQGRKLYVVPGPLTKSAAVREVVRRVGSTVTLAAGDSLLDIDLLAVADRGIRPGHGEIHDSGWSSPRVTALTSSGIRAGDDILRWFGRLASEIPQKRAASRAESSDEVSRSGAAGRL